MKKAHTFLAALMLTMTLTAQTLNIKLGNTTFRFPAALTGEMAYSGGTALNVMGRSFRLTDISEMTVTSGSETEAMATVAKEQLTGFETLYASPTDATEYKSMMSGLRLNFQMSGVTKVEVESVDGYALCGEISLADLTSQSSAGQNTNLDGRSIITFSPDDGQALMPGQDYTVATFPCDLYGGYRLSIYKDGLVAHYFGVHQVAEAGKYLMPLDLDESELEFVDPDAPLVEEERPGLNVQTRDALRVYKQNPTDENRLALLEVMGIRYDKVVARKKAKLRELEREAKHQSLIDEMQAIVDEMVENRDIRLEQQFLRLIDPREDDDPTDAWCVLRGAEGNNPYIGYAPVTNAEYAAYKADHTYPAGQENFPVVSISCMDAMAYCDWLSQNDATHSYRLPTEEDWIFGAGHMPKDVSMNSNFVESGLTAVDAYSQTTGACGGIDFWGNCWEWTSTQNDVGEYIVKGGAWDSSRDQCRSEYSGDSRDGTKSYSNVGFRVVRVDK